MSDKNPFSYKTDEEVAYMNISHTLAMIHAKKSKAYGNSWIARGFLRGFIPNVDRKIDRLNVITNTMFESGECPDDLPDTLADLAVYCIKGLTAVAEHYPEQFDKWVIAMRDYLGITDGKKESLQKTKQEEPKPDIPEEETLEPQEGRIRSIKDHLSKEPEETEDKM